MKLLLKTRSTLHPVTTLLPTPLVGHVGDAQNLLHETESSVISGVWSCFQKGYSARIKAIHYVNVPPYADMVISLMRSVMKPKIAGRVSYCCSHMTRAVLLHPVST